ncbi:hypothetical protein ACWEO1_24345, partial [Kitasatospora cineracea]
GPGGAPFGWKHRPDTRVHPVRGRRAGTPSRAPRGYLPAPSGLGEPRADPTRSTGQGLVTIAAPPEVHPEAGRAVFFVVEPDRARLADLAERVRDGRLRPLVGAVRPLAEAPAAFAPDRRTPGRTIIQVRSD